VLTVLVRSLAALLRPPVWAVLKAGFGLHVHGRHHVPRRGGVVFPVTNQTNRNINQIFGWVYGYEEQPPYRFKLVSNPHAPARRVTAGPHPPGETALYWFPVPAYHLKMKNYGVVVYDASVSFDR